MKRLLCGAAVAAFALMGTSAHAANVNGMFRGKITCGPTSAGVNLDIVASTAGKMRMVLALYTLPNNVAVPTHIAEFAGQFTASTGAIAVTKLNAWLAKPGSASNIPPFSAKLSTDGKTISATIPGIGCSTFKLTRLLP
jgi:hypothetical protein